MAKALVEAEAWAVVAGGAEVSAKVGMEDKERGRNS
jgi:hypothetical protein